MTSRRLLLVDGSNLVMRAALGGALAVETALQTAERQITRISAQLQATHGIIALDTPGHTWRREICADYKAHRTTDTAPYVTGMHAWFESRGWCCVAVPGFEGDDIVATIASRSAPDVIILSSDADLLACLRDGVTVARPVNGGGFERWDVERVRAEWGILPSQMADCKALMGDASDNIRGVPGIGPVRAAALLARHGSLDRLLDAVVPDASTDAAKVRSAGRDQVLLARRLATLETRIPLAPILPSACVIPRRRAA